MLKFTLSYIMPKTFDTEDQESRYGEKMFHLAEKVQAQAKEVFAEDVAFEVKRIGPSDNLADIEVEGSVIDNHNEYSGRAPLAQAEILILLQREASEEQMVECSWIRLRGESGRAYGSRLRPPSH